MEIATLPNRIKIPDFIEEKTYSVVLCILNLETGKIVMQDRITNAGRVTKALPGGTKDAGETGIATAIREAEEETGLIFDTNTPFPFFITKPFENERYTVTGRAREAAGRQARYDMYVQYIAMPTTSEELLIPKLPSTKELNPSWVTRDDIQSFADENLLYNVGPFQSVLGKLGMRIELHAREA